MKEESSLFRKEKSMMLSSIWKCAFAVVAGWAVLGMGTFLEFPRRTARAPRPVAPMPDLVMGENGCLSWTGVASFYGGSYAGDRTASGTRYRESPYTAAHRTLPFGTKLRVTDIHTGRSVVVIVNDRGPFIKGRTIDLSRAAAVKIGLVSEGVAPVKIERCGGSS
jgi:rare lipoprotein A (peptidoglycan hydrolase)